jgi:hypothetical protein
MKYMALNHLMKIKMLRKFRVSVYKKEAAKLKAVFN